MTYYQDKAFVYATDMKSLNKLPKEQLEHLTIRQLKQVAFRLNKEKYKSAFINCALTYKLGICNTHGRQIGKGKAISRLTKAELVTVILAARAIAQLPTEAYGAEWAEENHSERLVSVHYIIPDSSSYKRWTFYVGVESKQKAYQLRQYLIDKKQCQNAVVRRGKRLKTQYELKVYGVSEAAINALLNKEASRLPPDRVSYWQLKHETMIEAINLGMLDYAKEIEAQITESGIVFQNNAVYANTNTF